MSNPPLGLAVFDLDGTLLRGPTVCEVLAQALGRRDQMRQLEASISAGSDAAIAAARDEMFRWYRGLSLAELTGRLETGMLAPRASEGISLLKRYGVAVAIASITWEFAVARFARHLQVEHYVGTVLKPDGAISHFWPRDKATWIEGLRAMLRIPSDRVAAVGDSSGDIDMLRAARHSVFVGAILPDELHEVSHLPGADIVTVAEWIVGRLTARV